MEELKQKKEHALTEEDSPKTLLSPKKLTQIIMIIICHIKRLATFEIDKKASNWWKNEPKAAKVSLLSALVIGFLSHLFVYTGRYYGRDDMGTITRGIGPIGTGRWFNGRIISGITNNYVLPLVYGVLVTIFLAIASFYICKMFKIKKIINAILIASLVSTFPSIANTNLFLYETASYHLGVLIAVLAVYITVKYKLGFLIGGLFSMLVLATYQSKFNVVLALSLFYLISYLINENFSLKELITYIIKITSMIVMGAVSYAISLPISLKYYNTSYNNYRGFDAENMQSRLLTLTEFTNALKSTYANFRDGFFGNIYLIVDGLKHAYIAIAVFCIFFIILIVVSRKIYKQPLRLILIAALILLVPLASNFSNFFDTSNAYGLMIYAFVLTLVFAIYISEQCTMVYPIIRSIFTVCMILVIGNYIVGNNVYYLKAYFFNQRTFSLTTRILSRVDPLIPLSNSKRITFFGGLPNEYYPESNRVFREYGTIRDGSALGGTSYINYGAPNNFSLTQLATNINNLHGVRLGSLNWGSQWDNIYDEVLRRNMPVWPAGGSVSIIDDIIVVNFGLADVVFESDEYEQFFRARHWVSDGHAQHKYEYHWQVTKNGIKVESPITLSNRLYINMPNKDDNYKVSVTVKNANVNYTYPNTAIELLSGSYTANQNIFSNYLSKVLSDEHILILSVKDEASSSFNEMMQETLYSLGLNERLMGMYRYSYAAIINGHDVVFESISSEKISHTETIDDLLIEIVSAGYSSGNTSSILINSKEYSLNNRGINIVVIDKATKNIIDSVAFDTNSQFHTLTRRSDINPK